MATVHEASRDQGWLTRVLTTDFCPWANKFVYWLKEPVGWFVLAAAVSVFIGKYFSPIGWTMATALVAIIVVGMVWPWVAVRAVACSLTPELDRVHENEACALRFSVRNWLPIPIWGLAVEGFLDRKSDEANDQATTSIPTVALAFVRGLSLSEYRFCIRPELRGRYPESPATLTCSFPFGIWTARKIVSEVSPITVWPEVFPIMGCSSMIGLTSAEVGDGNRSGRVGDFIGVREYRRGDSAKHVNWVASARSSSLVVTERSGPQCPTIDVIVDGSSGCTRQEIADRIRVAASVLANLHRSGLPLRLQIGAISFLVRRGDDGFAQVMDALTDIPADGNPDPRPWQLTRGTTSIAISSDDHGNPVVHSVDPSINHRLGAEHRQRVVHRAEGLACQMLAFWTEVRDANLVA